MNKTTSRLMNYRSRYVTHLKSSEYRGRHLWMGQGGGAFALPDLENSDFCCFCLQNYEFFIFCPPPLGSRTKLCPPPEKK